MEECKIMYNQKLNEIMQAEKMLELLNGRKPNGVEEIKMRAKVENCLNAYITKHNFHDKQQAREKLVNLWAVRWNELAIKMSSLIHSTEYQLKRRMTREEVIEGFK